MESEFLHSSVMIANRKGLHARAAAAFVRLSDEFNADIWVEKGGQEVSGRSIMGLMMLAASQGTTINIRTSGEQAEQALNSLVGLVNEKFYED